MLYVMKPRYASESVFKSAVRNYERPMCKDAACNGQLTRRALPKRKNFPREQTFKLWCDRCGQTFLVTL